MSLVCLFHRALYLASMRILGSGRPTLLTVLDRSPSSFGEMTQARTDGIRIARSGVLDFSTRYQAMHTRVADHMELDYATQPQDDR